MKKLLIITLALITAAGAFALDRVKYPVVERSEQTFTVSGEKRTFTSYDAPAFYRIRMEGDFSYYNASCSLLMPEHFDKHDVEPLQRCILTRLADYVGYGDDPKPVFNTVDDAITALTAPDTEMKEVHPLGFIPEEAEDEMLFANVNVEVARQTADFIAFSFHSQHFMGGVASEGTKYLNYDLKHGRELEIGDIVSDKALQLVIAELKAMKIWNELWDEFKAAPYIAKGFYLSDTTLLLTYPRYEISYGAMGPVEVELPLAKVDKYLTPLAKQLIK